MHLIPDLVKSTSIDIITILSFLSGAAHVASEIDPIWRPRGISASRSWAPGNDAGSRRSTAGCHRVDYLPVKLGSEFAASLCPGNKVDCLACLIVPLGGQVELG